MINISGVKQLTKNELRILQNKKGHSIQIVSVLRGTKKLDSIDDYSILSYSGTTGNEIILKGLASKLSEKYGNSFSFNDHSFVSLPLERFAKDVFWSSTSKHLCNFLRIPQSDLAKENYTSLQNIKFEYNHQFPKFRENTGL